MPKFHPLKVKDIRRETNDCVSVAFEVPQNLSTDYSFIQGQYLTLKTNLRGEEVRRSYSICSSPLELDLRVAIKKVEGGLFSTFANEQLQIGDILDVMTPMGKFYTELNEKNAYHYVAFAAGSGITPIISIIKTTLEKEPNSHFTLIYGNRKIDSIIFLEEIEGLKNRYLGRLSVHHVLSRQQLGVDLLSGRIDEAKCSQFCQKLFDPATINAFFLCGPYEMIQSVRKALINFDVTPKQVYYELFTSPNSSNGALVKEKTSPKAIAAKIAIKLDDKTFEFAMPKDADSVLDAALKEGADLPFACKGGVCCTCKAKVLEGEVEMKINYGLEPDEVEAGFVLTCQSLPKTPNVKIDFDI